ncbi:MAG: indolepyruvate oxidoreductase subunit beta [Candidatus Helarchaeota archaeon]
MDENFSIILVGTGGQGVIRASSVLGWAVLQSNEDYQLRTAETHGMAQRGGSVIVHLRFGPDVESPLVKTQSADVLISFELVEAIRYINYIKKDGIILINNEIIIPPVLFRAQHIEIDPAICIGCGNCSSNCSVNTYFKNPKAITIIDHPALSIINGICQVLEGCTGCKLCIKTCSQNAITPEYKIRYPLYDEIENKLKSVSKNYHIIKASQLAQKLGDIRMTNIVMIGALLSFEEVPITVNAVKGAIRKVFNPKIADINIKALESGFNLIKK